MDINLHSFILVMGLLVIGFIVFDGIKKIRENKKNQLSTFDDQLDALNAEETHLHDQLAEQGYDEFEIADDLVDGAFVNDLGEELVESFDESVTSVEPSEESLEQHLQTMEEEDIGSFSATEELIEEPISSAAVESQQEYFEQDALAQYADDIEAPVSDIVDEAKDANTNNEAEFSVDNDQPENPHFTFSLKEEPEVEAPAQVKAKPKQRLSPEAAQAKKAALEAEAQAEKHEEKELAPLELDPEETVPVLMEPVELGEEVDPNPPVQHEMHLPEFVQQTLLEEPIFAKKDTAAEEQLQDYINMNLDEVSATDVPTIKAETQEVVSACPSEKWRKKYLSSMY